MSDCPCTYSGIASPWIRAKDGKYELVAATRSYGIRLGLHKLGWTWKGEKWSTTDAGKARRIARSIGADIREIQQAG